MVRDMRNVWNISHSSPFGSMGHHLDRVSVGGVGCFCSAGYNGFQGTECGFNIEFQRYNLAAYTVAHDRSNERGSW